MFAGRSMVLVEPPKIRLEPRRVDRVDGLVRCSNQQPLVLDGTVMVPRRVSELERTARAWYVLDRDAGKAIQRKERRPRAPRMLRFFDTSAFVKRSVEELGPRSLSESPRERRQDPLRLPGVLFDRGTLPSGGRPAFPQLQS